MVLEFYFLHVVYSHILRAYNPVPRILLGVSSSFDQGFSLVNLSRQLSQPLQASDRLPLPALGEIEVVQGVNRRFPGLWSIFKHRLKLSSAP